MKQEKIVCAANRICKDSGAIITVLGARHFDSLMHTHFDMLLDNGEVSKKEILRSEQGFVSNYGFFYTRDEALKIADEAGQVDWEKKTYPLDELFSEDLY